MAGFGHSEDGLQPGCPPGSAGRRGGGVRGGAGGAQIHDTAALTQSARSADVVVDHVRDQLIGLLGLDGSRFEYGTLLGHPPRLEPDGTISMTGHARRDVEQRGLPGEEIELRTFGNGQYYGRFMLKPKPGSRPSRQSTPGRRHARQSGRARSPPARLPAANDHRPDQDQQPPASPNQAAAAIPQAR